MDDNIKISTVGTSWFLGLVLAIVIIIILNIAGNDYYNQLFCGILN